jgi:hypothetical protein
VDFPAPLRPITPTMAPRGHADRDIINGGDGDAAAPRRVDLADAVKSNRTVEAAIDLVAALTCLPQGMAR